MLLTAFCGGAFGAVPCRPTGELQGKAQADIAVDGCADVRILQDVVTVTFTGAVSFVRLKASEYSWSSANDGARGSWFKDARFGMFIHWGIYSIPGKGVWSYAIDKYAPGEYEANAKIFNPTNYNPREWARLAKRAGMKYAVLTTRHHDGFCMFDSHFTDYKITNTPYGRDAVREYVEAFRAEGLKVGFYHSLPDWTHPGYSDPETPAAMKGLPVHDSTPEEYAAFKELVANHMHQLMTEYGKIDLLFLDYTSKYKQNGDYFDRERLLKIAYENQPGIIVNDRLSFWIAVCDVEIVYLLQFEA
jgi:alpha-L-fucosidase